MTVQSTFVLWGQQAGPIESEILKLILGPLGVLVLLLVAWIMGWKYFKEYSAKKDAEIAELRAKYDQARDDIIEEKARRIQYLESKLGNGPE